MKISLTNIEDKSWEEWFQILVGEAKKMNASFVSSTFTNPFETEGWVLSIQVMTTEEYEEREL